MTGDAVAILSGPQAGHWRTIAQRLAPRRTCSTSRSRRRPTPSRSRPRSSRDLRGEHGRLPGQRDRGRLVLAGNLFGVRVVNNRFLGGGESIRLLATPTEEPVRWGWSHAPFLGGSSRGTRSRTPPAAGSASSTAGK